MFTLLVLYAGIIPFVPLIGAEIYKRRQDNLRRNACLMLFCLQMVLSACYVAAYFYR